MPPAMQPAIVLLGGASGLNSQRTWLPRRTAALPRWHAPARHWARKELCVRAAEGQPDLGQTAAQPQTAVAGAAADPTPKAQPAPRLPAEVSAERLEVMLVQLQDWRDKYYECIVPRQAFDAKELGEWVHRVRRLRAQGRLPEDAVSRLDEAGFVWRVDVIAAKWYHNLHIARRYKALHGTAEIPPDYADPSEPDFVEAGRWLARQRELYERQKLLRVRVRLLKEALGVRLERSYAPRRRNLHPVIRREDGKFERELQRRAQQGQHGEQAQQQRQARPQQAQRRTRPAALQGGGLGLRLRQPEAQQQAAAGQAEQDVGGWWGQEAAGDGSGEQGGSRGGAAEMAQQASASEERSRARGAAGSEG